MTIVKRKSQARVKKRGINLWFERFMALIATINLCLVAFDLTYVPLRDFWLYGEVRIGDVKSAYIELEGITVDLIPPTISQFITQYDVVKGIVPHRTTEAYLAKVERLEQELVTERATDLKAINTLLGDLRRQSIEIIQTNPFAEANKTGTLERIKNRMREYLPNSENSARQAFWQFWSPAYFLDNPTAALNFFNLEIQPLIASNYYREIGENGGYINYFGFIDFPFGVIFGLEFLARTWYISRRRTGISWLDAMLWRWYDIFFLLPFWRWLRIIPVVIRLDQARIISLNSIQKQISQGIVAGIAEDVTEVVVIRLINQMQTSVRQGDIGRLLSQSGANPYIDINNTNEIAEIIRILAKTIADRVLPAVKPEAETLLQYSIEKALKQSPAYQGIKFLPGSERTISTLSQQLISQSYEAFSGALQAALAEDKQFDRLLESLVANISKSVSSELQAQQSLDKIELLLLDFLEEIKINYVERLSAEDIEEILEQTRSIRKITQ